MLLEDEPNPRERPLVLLSPAQHYKNKTLDNSNSNLYPPTATATAPVHKMASSNQTATPQQAKESKSSPQHQPNADGDDRPPKTPTPTPTPNPANQAKKALSLDTMTQDQQLDLFHRTRPPARQVVPDRKYAEPSDALQNKMLACLQDGQTQQQQQQQQLARRSRPQPLRAQYAQIEAVAPEYFADVRSGRGDEDDTEDEIITELEGLSMNMRDWVGR